MVADMGMTNKQFQGFIRLALAQIERALKETPDNKELQELKDIFFEIAPTKDYNPYEEQLMRENSPFPEVDYSGSLELRDEVIEKMRKLGTQKVAREIYRYLTDSANTEAPLTFVKNLE